MQKKLDKTLLQVVQILNKYKINYWICHGTLLGLVRDKKIISNTSDIDIGIWKNDYDKKKIIKIFSNLGYKKKNKFFRNDGLLTLKKKGMREVDISLHEKSLNQKTVFFRNYHFRNIFCRIVDVLAKSKKYNGNFKFVIKNMSFIEPIAKKIKFFSIKKKYFYTQYGYFVPAKILNNITTLKFKNLNIRAPKNYLDYLKCVYGKSWKIPIKKKFNWIKDSPSTKKIN